MKALVVEDTKISLTAVCGMLERMGITPIPARNGRTGMAQFEAQKPDLVLLDILLPDIDGYEVARHIRALESGRNEWTPIIFLTGCAKDADVERGIEVGGDDYLVKPVSEVVLAAKIRAMRRIMQMRQSLLVLARKLDTANRELMRVSAVDGLTGVANRRHFDEAIVREWRRGIRGQHWVSVLLCDVDCFKAFNDSYGHQAGDECLRDVARALDSAARRPADLVARYGGEEFGVVLPETAPDGAVRVAEGMRRAVLALGLPHVGSPSGGVTVSIGVAGLIPSSDSDKQQLLSAADRALYDAKRKGRNQVSVHGLEVIAVKV